VADGLLQYSSNIITAGCLE